MPYQALGLHKGRKARNARNARARKKAAACPCDSCFATRQAEITPAAKPLAPRSVLRAQRSTGGGS